MVNIALHIIFSLLRVFNIVLQITPFKMSAVLDNFSEKSDSGTLLNTETLNGNSDNTTDSKEENITSLMERFGSLFDCTRERREGVVWTEAEKNALMEGYNRFGKKWTTILAEYAHVFASDRRYRDLSDKVRLIKKITSYYTTPKKDFYEVGPDDNPVLNGMGEMTLYSFIHPNRAAIAIAKRKHLVDGDTIIKIRGVNIADGVFVYRAFVNEGRVCVRKLAGISIHRKDGYV